MNPDLMRYRDKAAQVQSHYYERLAALKDDGDLTSEARQRRMAQVHADARRDLKTLADQDRAHLASRFEVLQSRLYRMPEASITDQGSHAISLRDAAARVAQLRKPEEAAESMAVAESSGDGVMARAILRFVCERSAVGVSSVDDAWNDVARYYIDRHPEAEGLVDELADIEDLSTPQIFSCFTATTPSGVDQQYLNEAANAVAAGVSAGAVA